MSSFMTTYRSSCVRRWFTSSSKMRSDRFSRSIRPVWGSLAGTGSRKPSALGKPMVLLLDPDGEYAGMIHGLGAVVPTATVKLTGKSLDFRELERAVFDVMGRARKAA